MRKLFIIITILIAVGCTSRQDYSPRLLAIEQSARKDPTATLQKLEDSKTVLRSRGDSMLYVLIYSEAARSMGMTFTSEEWISPTVEFFDSVGDKDRTVRSMLMLALCYYDEGKYDKAAEWLIRTRDNDSGSNPSLRYKLYLTLGDINNIVGRNDEKNFDFGMAYKAANSIGDKGKEVSALYKSAVSYYNDNQKDSLRSIANKLENIAGKAESYEATAQTAEGMYRLLAKDTTAALSLFSRSQSTDVDFRATSLSANILYNRGDKKDAIDLWLIAANSADRDVAIDALNHLIDNVEPMSYKLELSQNLNKLYAGKPTAETTAKVIEVQKHFDEMASEEQSRHKIVLLTIVVGVLLVVITIISALIIRHHKQQKRDKQTWNIERELLNSDIAQRLHKLASTGQEAEADDRKELDNLISGHDPRLRVLLLKHSELSATERHVAELIRLRFQPSEIAVLLDLSPQRVTNTRSRLLQRLFNTKGGAKNFDSRIRGL